MLVCLAHPDTASLTEHDKQVIVNVQIELQEIRILDHRPTSGLNQIMHGYFPHLSSHQSGSGLSRTSDMKINVPIY